MTRLLSGCLLLAVFLAPVQVLAEEQSGGKAQKYAFLVGCSKYLKTEFRELPFTGNDIKGFRDALVQTGFPEEHVVVLHDAAGQERRYLPEKANIFQELDMLMDGMREQDTLVIALSGHGLQFKGDPVSYFVPVDGRVEDKSTLIALSGKGGLYDRLKSCKAQQKLLIVNACRNDPTSSLSFSSNKTELADEDRKEVPEGIAAIFSCKAGQMSYYDPDRKVALFFHHVIRAWKGEYDGAGEVTLENFFHQVTVKTKMDANKALGVAQTPTVQREYVGKWLIVTPELAAARASERLLASEFAEFTQLWLGSWQQAESWLDKHAAGRLAAWRDAADRGSVDAMVLVGNVLGTGHGPLANDAEAVKWYRKASEKGNGWAQHDLGVMYQTGRGVAKNEAEAVKWFRISAEQANPEGQDELGLCYQIGRGVAKDEIEAVKWYRKSAEQGDGSGQNHLGWMYHNGWGVAKDEAEAVKWYRKSVEQGHAVGQNNLGWMYQRGLGVAKDEAEALKWYRIAAEQGLATAQNNLGWMYHNGKGVSENVAEAAKWYRKSAEQGNVWGQNELGMMYKNGQGVTRDDAEAAKWFRKAADQGQDAGQNNLGVMYEDGRGVSRNLAEAVRLYRLASRGGNQVATAALRRLGKQ